MTQTGRILRFDEARGYGFIVADKGGDDVFVHANEFCDDKELFTAGTPVEFEVAESERGLKAFAVHLAEPRDPSTPATVGNAEGPAAATALSGAARLAHEFTDLLLERVPDLTGAQITELRGIVLQLAQNHGWTKEMAT
jgi:cold shock CspA family protein